MTQKHVNMAFYLMHDWNRLLSIVDDKESLHTTWEQWHDQYLTTKIKLESEGIKVNDVIVDIDELVRFCFQKGIKIDGKARSQFVALIKK